MRGRIFVVLDSSAKQWHKIWIFHLLSCMESVLIMIDPSVLSFYDLAPLCAYCAYFFVNKEIILPWLWCDIVFELCFVFLGINTKTA